MSAEPGSRAGRRSWRERVARVEGYLASEPGDPWRGLGRRDEQLVYLLARDPWSSERTPVLKLGMRQRLVSGQWGRLRPFESSWSRPFRGLTPEDERVLALLRGGRAVLDPGDWDRKESERGWGLDPHLARELLPIAAGTGRLHREHDGEPGVRLCWDGDEPWRLVLALEREPSGERSILRGLLERGGKRLVLGARGVEVLGCVLLAGSRAAPLDARGAESWLEELGQGGAIECAGDEESALARAVLASAGAARVELPEELDQDLVEPLTPRPSLRVGRPDEGATGRSLLECWISFDYAGVLVPLGDLVPVVEAGARLVRRNVERERDALALFLALGGRRDDEDFWERDATVAADKLPGLVAGLVDSGWDVEAEGRRFRAPASPSFSVRASGEGFELAGGVPFGDETVPLPRLLAAVRARERFVRLDDGTAGVIPEEWLARWGLLDALSSDVADGVALSRAHASLLDALLEGTAPVVDRSFAELREKLETLTAPAPAREPDGFEGELRGYQREGLGWLRWLDELGLGGCLADDMGLGKTVQVLAFLAGRERGVPALVVAPRSLVSNWAREARRFAPGLSVLEYVGGARHEALEQLPRTDLVITTYGTLRRDIAHLEEEAFDVVVLDEAQAIKNPLSQTAKAARRLNGARRVALSGTPVENHLGELWSLFEFLEPGLLGRSTAFQRALTGPVEDEESRGARALLARVLRPFLLRRTKEQVLTELPPKVEQTLYCDMGDEQRSEYVELREYYRGMLAGGALESPQIQVLEALVRLRQAACHPGLIDPGRVDEGSAKLDVLVPMLTELRERGHKALVFSQFTRFLDVLRQRLDAEDATYEWLDGRTTRRQERVDRFQSDPDCHLFLISLKAGGVGLNLTAADYVFLLDPWWNPAVECQAIDRAHRMGRRGTVVAYRLVTRGTVEERVVELQEHKRELADSILHADAGPLAALGREEIEALLS